MKALANLMGCYYRYFSTFGVHTVLSIEVNALKFSVYLLGHITRPLTSRESHMFLIPDK